MLHVVVIGDEGKSHLEIYRKLARGTTSLLPYDFNLPRLYARAMSIVLRRENFPR